MEPAEVAQQGWWQYGVLGVGVVVFGLVIRFLFKQYQREVRKYQESQAIIAEERKGWAVERERIRAEYDQCHHDLLREYAEKIQQEHKECQEREDRMREEHDARVERMADEQAKSNESLIAMLEKLQERMVLSRSRGGQY